MIKKRVNPSHRWRTIGTFLPDWLLAIPLLTPTEKLLYARIARFAMQKGYAFAKQTTLARELGVARSTIQLLVRKLVEQGLIEVVQNGPTKENHYFLLENPWEAAWLNSSTGVAQGAATDIAPLLIDADRIQGSQSPESGQPSNIEEDKIKKEYHTQGSLVPSLLQVVQEGEGLGISAEVSEAFYLAKKSVGWRQNGQPIVDWRSALEAYHGAWNRRLRRPSSSKAAPKPNRPYQTRKYDNQLISDEQI